jgi:hypothetical protein
MKKLSMKTLITLSIVCLGLFGIVRADEVVTETTLVNLARTLPLVTLLHLLAHILD